MAAQTHGAPSLQKSAFVRLGHRLTLIGFGITVAIFIAAPIVALSWRSLPFPGFFVEQTLVINDNKGENWSGLAAGVVSGQHLERIGGIEVNNAREYRAALSSFDNFGRVSVFVTSRDRTGMLIPTIILGRLSSSDFIRFFWLPYLIGLVYLGVGVWIYRARGNVFSGLALAIFCVLTAVICALIFDLSTTHIATGVWTTAISLVSASLISLGMSFPQEWRILRKRLWALALPYAISLPLAVWNLLASYNNTDPWAYHAAWGASYRFLAFAILFFIGVLIYQERRSASATVRRQARIVLLGSALAFLPILAWFISPLANLPITFNVSLFLPPLILFPLSVAIAILRYRLLEIDMLVNRAIVYGVLTAIIAGLFTAMIILSQKVFIALTGSANDAALVITTLIVGSAIAPIRARIQAFVDKQFKESPDDTRALQAFSEQVGFYIQMNSPEELTRRLLHESAAAVRAESGAFALLNGDPGKVRILHTYQRWRGETMLSLPVETNGQRYGVMLLGPRTTGQPYTQQEYRLLKQISDQTAAAIRMTGREPDSPDPHTAKVE